jgi:hypothetical protein
MFQKIALIFLIKRESSGRIFLRLLSSELLWYPASLISDK